MKNNYIFIGDSIVYGIGDYESNGYTSMFKHMIMGLDQSTSCSNYVHIAAYPGSTSNDIASRIDAILDSFTFEGVNNIAVLSIGVNDTQTIENKQKVDIKIYEENIKKIIESVRKHNSNIQILGLTRIESEGRFYLKSGKFMDNRIIDKYDELLQNICVKEDVKYIKMSDALEKDDFIDGLHPNNEGHKKIYNNVLNDIYMIKKK